MNGASAYEAVTESPVGFLRIRVAGGKLHQIAFAEGPSRGGSGSSPCVDLVLGQLQQYFERGDFRFSLELEMAGTPFQRRVWEALCRIQPGDVRTYGEIAKLLGSSPRAVGNACRRNPIPIVVPCHRVVSATGIGGYAGATGGRLLRAKRWLLDHERGTG